MGKNIFKEGDIVYHPLYKDRECKVTQLDGISVQVKCVSTGTGMWREYSEFSFKPWPAPCHERPIEDGWWICSDKTIHEPYPLIRKVFNGEVEFKVGSTTVKTNLHKWDFHKFLGKDWK